jgi:uncharacterized OB-fold protein
MIAWDGPRPVANSETADYWDALRQHTIRIRRCQDCRHWIHPPVAMCPSCGSADIASETVSGSGSLYSFTEVHREFVPGIAPPYVSVLVELEEQPGLRIVGMLVQTSADGLQIGERVRPVFHDVGDGATLLLFDTEDRGETDAD